MFPNLGKSKLNDLLRQRTGLWSSYDYGTAFTSDQVCQVCTTLAEKLGFRSEDAQDPQKVARIVDYYLPVTLWCAQQSTLGKLQGSGAVVVGLSMPQGAGKTTLVECLGSALDTLGIRTGFCSIDDFYLTHEEQLQLQQRFPTNHLLKGRGLAGTHDVGLGVRTISQLVQSDARRVAVPRYDKAAFGGTGDRAQVGSSIQTPLDLVVLEGWMLGFRPVDKEVVDAYPGMQEVNEMLEEYQKWNALLDSVIVAAVDDHSVVYKWREEAEVPRRAAGCGLSEEDVVRFCDRYMPSYKVYAPKLYEQGVKSVPHNRTLRFKLNNARVPFGQGS